MKDFDAHAHPGAASDDALIATSSASAIKAAEGCRYRALGSIPPDESPLEALEMAAASGFHIGEIGLDRRYPYPERQLSFFRGALAIAREYDRIAVIHCVRADGALYDALKESGVRKFIIHGYTGSYEMALRYAGLGGMISLSPRARAAKSFGRLITLPFLTETDMAAGKEQEETLRKWNGELSALTGIDTAERTRRLIFTWL